MWSNYSDSEGGIDTSCFWPWWPWHFYHELQFLWSANTHRHTHYLLILYVNATVFLSLSVYKINADRLHQHNCPHTLTDYRCTDKHLRLLMPPIALNCTWQSQALNIDRCIPENWPWPLALTLDLEARKQWCQNMIFDIWPWPLTYDLDLQS